MICGKTSPRGKFGNIPLMTASQLQKAFANKRFFLTGHTGFKGSWMLAILNKWNATVKGYALDPQHANDHYNLIEGDAMCESVIADIRDKDKVREEIERFQPDVVIHMAAQPLVLDSYEDPIYTYETNVMGTAYVLDAIKRLQKPCVSVIITTDKVYENLERDIPYKEDDRLGGFDPYSNSKACADLLTTSYIRSFFSPEKYQEHQKSISVVRSGNVIGGGDWSAHRIIPDTAKALADGKELTMRNPSATRPWQHVLEPVVGYLILAAHQMEEPLKFASAFNFGPENDDVLTVKELVEEAISVWGSGSFTVPTNHVQPHEAGLLKLAIEKAKHELNWTPQYDSKSAIAVSMEWYKAFNDGELLTNTQINNYLDLCK